MLIYSCDNNQKRKQIYVFFFSTVNFKLDMGGGMILYSPQMGDCDE